MCSKAKFEIDRIEDFIMIVKHLGGQVIKDEAYDKISDFGCCLCSLDIDKMLDSIPGIKWRKNEMREYYFFRVLETPQESQSQP